MLDLYLEGGLSGLTDKLLSNWIQPVYLVAVAVFAIIFIKDRSFTKLIAFVAIAAVVGVFVFAGDSLFGKSGALTNTAVGIGNQIDAP